MKTLFTFFLAIALLGCKPQPSPFYTYTFNIEKEVLSLDGTGLVKEVVEDTIRARTDVQAYQSALYTYHAERMTAERFEGRMGKVFSFELQDSLGENVADKLGIVVADSMQQQVQALVNQSGK